jgi:hypothetical protein
MADDDVERTKFQKKIQVRPGEWDFAGFYTRPEETSANKDVLLAENIRTIVNVSHREMRIATIMDSVSRFIKQHEECMRDYASALHAKRNDRSFYIASPIAGEDKYYAFMDGYINALRKASADFKVMVDPAQKNAGMKLLEAWMSDGKLSATLDDALRLATDTKLEKNDLLIKDKKLSERIENAYKDLAPITTAFQATAIQPLQAARA